MLIIKVYHSSDFSVFLCFMFVGKKILSKFCGVKFWKSSLPSCCVNSHFLLTSEQPLLCCYDNAAGSNSAVSLWIHYSLLLRGDVSQPHSGGGCLCPRWPASSCLAPDAPGTSRESQRVFQHTPVWQAFFTRGLHNSPDVTFRVIKASVQAQMFSHRWCCSPDVVGSVF